MASTIDIRTATIAQLFPLWKEHRNVDPLNLPPINVKDASYDRYREIQIAVEDRRPTTAAEYAMKLVVCTDDFDSEYPAPLEQEVRDIAEQASQTNSIDALMELITRYQRVEAEYNAHPAEDLDGLLACEVAHSSVLDELAETKHEAQSLDTVIAALRQALVECDDRSPKLAASLLRGALAFFDAAPAREDAR